MAQRDPEDDRLVAVGLMAARRFPDEDPKELQDVERLVRAYELAGPGRRVRTFEEWQAAIGSTDEARFVRWKEVRYDAEERLHRRERGY